MYFQVIALVFATLCALVEGRILVRRQQPKQGLVPIYADEKADPGYNPAPKGYKKGGQVGPVFTFVKTDPYANFKWGVRHVAGVQYGRRR